MMYDYLKCYVVLIGNKNCNNYNLNCKYMACFLVVGTKPPFGVSPTSPTVKSTTMVALPPPPTMPSVNPSMETGTLTTILDLMGEILPKLQSCCCALDMPGNLNASTPSLSDGKSLCSSNNVVNQEGSYMDNLMNIYLIEQLSCNHVGFILRACINANNCMCVY